MTISAILVHLSGVIFGRCPRCNRGSIFRGIFKMYPDCSNCTLQFEREYGYFLMSIFIAYFIDMIVLLPVGIWQFRHRVPTSTAVTTLLILLIVLTPLSFRYSRIVWLHIDHQLDPGAKKNNVKR